MSHVTDLPVWVAAIVCVLLLAGSALTLIGAIGLLRLDTIYRRLHAPTLGASGGALLISLASMICFAVLQSRWIFHEVLIVSFVVLTTPVTMMMLGQSALYRDRVENRKDVPSKANGEPIDPELNKGADV
ncbi:multicomponent K+:H+ antiporter subunit G [Pararhizobium capsulatum DSM 1112]|uniref:Multicomponent K+:H+ antiporter subunit G n=1 Tax=Pararhizobium capsulatum DSM 1112 TaxID=1121113 RepID=A0ABU0BW92_9HYPH|nr:monovalent cation/H(+) antiporter subunit G [Pararhizobium capsulatum]MDQ0321936.1 multicomponent K+:H+ antiporter subunit G [Pararhizobium capsulatum DSM 1112]